VENGRWSICSGAGGQFKLALGGQFDWRFHLISFLKQKGNENATFKSQYDKDYNPDGGEKFRGRHAWKGFDSEECVNWITKIINDE